MESLVRSALDSKGTIKVQQNAHTPKRDGVCNMLDYILLRALTRINFSDVFPPHPVLQMHKVQHVICNSFKIKSFFSFFKDLKFRDYADISNASS